MPGFFISNTKEIPVLHNYDDANCVAGSMVCGQWNISWNVLNKYMDDKLFYQNDDFVILLDGVILNKRDLMAQLKTDSWADAVCCMIRQDPRWFQSLRGVFSGAVLDKHTNIWSCFTDQCGAHLLMTYENNQVFACGSQVNYFSDWMTCNGIKKEINPEWQQDILTCGYMRENYSVLSGVNRVFPGCVYRYQAESGIGKEESYYQVTKKNRIHISAEDAIAKLDETFHQAIRRIIEKDREYGYRTVVDISGGLDSRMNAAVAAQEGGSQVFGLTYAQRGSDDQMISQQVASTLGLEQLFYPMDGGNFMKEVDDLIFMNNGFNDYFGITAGKYLLSLLDKKTFGIEIWGLLGDIYEGGMSSDYSKELDWKYDRFHRSHRFPAGGVPSHPHAYEDNEIMWFYVRGMLAGMNTGLIRQNYVEPVTPYGDVEFMNLCFSLSEQLRFDEHIYRQWMIERYPEMANIRYSGTGVRVMPGNQDDLPVRLRYHSRRLYSKLFGTKDSWSMNPIASWYQHNADFREYIETYYSTQAHLLTLDPAFGEKVKQLFSEGNVLEKLMAVSVLSALKQYIA